MNPHDIILVPISGEEASRLDIYWSNRLSNLPLSHRNTFRIENPPCFATYQEMLDSVSSSPHADRISIKAQKGGSFSWRKFLVKRLTSEELIEIENLARETVLKRDCLELRFQFSRFRRNPEQYSEHHNTATLVFGEEEGSILGYKMFFPYQVAEEFRLPDQVSIRQLNCVAFANQGYH